MTKDTNAGNCNTGHNNTGNRIEELEAKLAKAEEGLTVIDALDPEGLIDGCSRSALIGLVLRMGESPAPPSQN